MEAVYGFAAYRHKNKIALVASCGLLALGVKKRMNDGAKVEAVKNAGYTAKLLESLAAVASVPGAKYLIMKEKQLSSSCRAGIWDQTSKTWAVRLDNPHRGMKDHHININYKLTGVRDPHLKVPSCVVKTGDVATQAVQTLGTAAFVMALFYDSYRLVRAYYDDYHKSGSMIPGKQTAFTGASVVSAWTGGLIGAGVGNIIGAKIGFLVFLPFGLGIAVPVAAVTSLAGTVYGGYYGCMKASTYVESFCKK